MFCSNWLICVLHQILFKTRSFHTGENQNNNYHICTFRYYKTLHLSLLTEKSQAFCKILPLFLLGTNYGHSPMHHPKMFAILCADLNDLHNAVKGKCAFSCRFLSRIVLAIHFGYHFPLLAFDQD